MINTVKPLTIISGGQTGVDRAALDIAIETGIPHSGWCPQGRLAEDGTISDRYHLQETQDKDYKTRTRLNVQDSDGTLIINRGVLDGGTAITLRFAQDLKKPVLVINLEQQQIPGEISAWLSDQQIKVLNIAGPRESKRPGIYTESKKLLLKLLGQEIPGDVQLK